MRSDDREAGGPRSIPGPIRRGLWERLGRLGRRFRDPESGPWRASALAVAAVLVASASAALLGHEERRLQWLGGGRPFVIEEARTLRALLAADSIEAEVDDRGRVGVAAEDFAEAVALARSSGLDRRTTLERLNNPETPSLLDGPVRRAEVALRQQAGVVEAAVIAADDAILNAVVVLTPGPSRSFEIPRPVKAGVQLFFERGRAPSAATLEGILNIVVTFTGVPAEDVMILDARGKALVQSGDPGAVRSMRDEIRARDWQAAIAEEIGRMVDGAIVVVTPEEPDGLDRSTNPRRAPAGAVVAAPMSLDRPPSIARDDGPNRTRANVLVEVPAGFYNRRYRDFNGGREPRFEDLAPFVDYTREQIEVVVAHVIPADAMGELRVLMLPLEPEDAEEPAASGPWRRWSAYWWAPAVGLGGVAGLALLAAAGGVLPRRHALERPSGAIPTPHLTTLDVDEPGPADRVRELVRRDPEAAAAVLRRWVGPGGDV